MFFSWCLYLKHEQRIYFLSLCCGVSLTCCFANLRFEVIFLKERWIVFSCLTNGIVAFTALQTLQTHNLHRTLMVFLLLLAWKPERPFYLLYLKIQSLDIWLLTFSHSYQMALAVSSKRTRWTNNRKRTIWITLAEYWTGFLNWLIYQGLKFIPFNQRDLQFCSLRLTLVWR